MKKVLALSAVLAVFSASSVMAALTLVDDFESYSVGSYSGGSDAFVANGGPWESNVGGGTGLVAIENDGNNYLAYGWNQGQRGAIRTVPTITEGSTATYYFQIRTEDATPDVSYGLTDVAPGAFGYGDFEVQIALTYDASTGIRLGARNGGTTMLNLESNLLANTWYDIWVEVDNSADTFDLYFGTSGDPEVMGSLIANDFGFRNGSAANDLVSFLTLSNFNEDNNANLDNIYTSIPEPATIGLIGIFGGGLLVVRRRMKV